MKGLAYLQGGVRFLPFTTAGVDFLQGGGIPVAGPGISPGGAPTPRIAIIFNVLAENYMKIKKFVPGGNIFLVPPLDPPIIHNSLIRNHVRNNFLSNLLKLIILVTP